MPAKKGNKNAFKHGIYSSFIAVIDDQEMAGMSDESPKDELAIARAKLKNALTKAKDAVLPADQLGWDAAVRHYIVIITDIKARTVEKRQTENMVWTSLMAAVDAANDKQHVQR
jgi:hypothetical protein